MFEFVCMLFVSLMLGVNVSIPILSAVSRPRHVRR